MRVIQTFILRLLVDTEAPMVLRGALRSVTESETLTFVDEQTLLAMLHRLAHSTPEAAATENPEITNIKH